MENDAFIWLFTFVIVSTLILRRCLITANNALLSILTGQLDKSFQYRLGSEALMNASEIASELAIPSYSKHYLTRHKIHISLQNSASLLSQLSKKQKLNENETAQLNEITKLVDVYFDLMKKSNANTGYIDDLTMRCYANRKR